MLTNAERRAIRRQAEDILDGCEGGQLTGAEHSQFESLMEQLRSDDLKREAVNGTTISANPHPEPQKKYRSHERLADAYQGANDLSLDRVIRGIATGYWDGAEAEKRAMSEGTATAGGHLVPAPLAARVIDKARSQSVAVQAGASTVPMDSETLKYATVTGDPTIAIVGEGSAISDSDFTFGSSTLTAFKLASLHFVSLELLEDANNLESFIESSLAEQFALGMDNQVLNGTGSSAPTGILNTSGINSVAVSGALANYDKFSDAVGEIRKDNFYNPLGMVIHPRDVAALDKLKDTTNQPLVPPQSYSALNMFQSSQLAIDGGSGSDESNIIIGDFSELLLGMRTELRLEISREAKDAFEKGQVAIRAYMRFGVSIPRPTAFCKLTGVQG
jgi:HK97 family phage major capsid protein